MIQKIGLAVGNELEDQFAEEGVLPGKPGTGETGGVVLVEGLVHETLVSVGTEEQAHTVADLIVVLMADKF